MQAFSQRIIPKACNKNQKKKEREEARNKKTQSRQNEILKRQESYSAIHQNDYLKCQHSDTHRLEGHSIKYLSCVLSSVKRGLLLGSYDQHFVIKL